MVPRVAAGSLLLEVQAASKVCRRLTVRNRSTYGLPKSSNAALKEEIDRFLESAPESSEPFKDDLPTSPLLNPDLQRGREKFSSAKPAPGELSDFRQLVSKNPYANILASPVRTCALSGSRLPKDLLFQTSLRLHSETGVPWQVPEGLLRENDDNPSQEAEPGRNDAKNEEKRPDKAGLSNVYFTATREAVQYTSDMPPRLFGRTVPTRWKLRIPGQTISSIVWRKDMAPFAEELLSRKITNQLVRASKSQEPKLRAFNASTPEAFEGEARAAATVPFNGAVLWLGDSSSSTDSKELLCGTSDSLSIIRTAQSGAFPVFDLEQLLPPSHLQMLRRIPIFQNESLILHNSAKAIEWIWRLCIWKGLSRGKDAEG